MTVQQPADTGAAPATPSPATSPPANNAPAAQPNTAPANDQPANGQPANQNAPANQSADSRIDDKPAFKIPDAFKDKPWAAKIKTEEDLYKQVENLSTLVGKKTVAPDFTKATPKEIEDYYSQTRPANKDDYKFAETETPENKAAFADMFYKNGISSHQANAIIEQVTAYNDAKLNHALDKGEFKKELQKSFGDDFDKPAAETAKQIKANVSPDDQKLLDQMPNQFLGVLYRLTAKLHQEYGVKESGAPAEGAQGGGAETDVKAVQAGYRKQLNDLDKRPHTQAEKQAIIDKLDATYKTGKR